jgi:hypothetical protein
MLDTLEFARRMIEAGMPEKTAEALAHELRDALPESQAATKADLAEMRTEFEKLRTDVKADVGGMRTDVEKLRTDFANLKVWVLLIVIIGQVLPVLGKWLHWF